MRARIGRLLCAAVVALLPGTAAAQSIVNASATPSPFPSGATITVTATLAPGASPESWCSPSLNQCYIVSMQPLLQVVGSNGFVAQTEDWYAQWHDAAPGQTMQPVTYTVYGSVYWTVCWGIGWCFEYYSYAESGSTQTSVTPAPTPVSVGVTPSSGFGLSQTFTFQYSSTAGGHAIAEAWMVFGAGYAHSCVIGLYAQAQVLVLWHDSGVGAPHESSAPLGTPAVLENSQCRVYVGGASRVVAGNSLSVTVPVEFKPAYFGMRPIYMHAKNTVGVYSSPHLAGTWTVPECSYQVTPTTTTVGATAGALTVSVTAPPTSCAWTPPAGSAFLSLSEGGPTTGPGFATYAIAANTSASPRSTQLTVAGQLIAVTQVGTGQAPPEEGVYYFSDGIGSVRMTADANGGNVQFLDYLPFGQEAATPQAERIKFAGKERDTETGTAGATWLPLDYFGARYYQSQAARFTAVDPVFTWEENLVDPQRWNRYAYARNNPIRYTDPDGRSIKLATLAFKVAHAAYKGYDLYTTVEGVVDAGGAVFGADSTLGERALGVVALAGELTGVTHAVKGVKAAANIVGNARDTARSGGRAVIGKLEDIGPSRLAPNEHTLLPHLPDQGSARANWKQNARVLRTEIRKGKPIRDASVDPKTGELLNNTGFLRAERELLMNQGWRYDPGTQFWSPP